MLSQTVMPTLAQTGATLPEGGAVSLFIALGAGFALWLAGVKIVRAVFIALGAALGGFAGAILLPLSGMPTLNLGPVPLTPGFTGLIVGGIIGALASLGMLRVVVATTAAAAFGVAGAMAALVFLHLQPTTADTAGPDAALAETDAGYSFDASDLVRDRAANELTDAVNALSDDLPEGSAASNLIDDLNTEENRQRIRDAAERSKEFVSRLAEAVKADYERRPARDKLILLSATLAGVGLGLVVGAVMPNRSAALVTSLFGSAMWMAAGVALLRAGMSPPPEILRQPPVTWAVVWGVAAVVGMAVQFGLLKRRGDTNPAKDDDEDD